jgi:S-adenosylmethionine decarboxylase
LSDRAPESLSSPGFPGGEQGSHAPHGSALSGGQGDLRTDRTKCGGGAPSRPAPPPSPYEGRHLIAELHGCSGLADIQLIETALERAAAAAGATLLETRLHGFGERQGVTGVALLAESHISIHTWPEHGYAAVDIFLCAPRHDLEAALAVLSNALKAERVEQQLIARGYAAATSQNLSHPGSGNVRA